MKLEYPELADISEFDTLQNKELKFVWFFANQTSPFINIKNRRERGRLALDAAFGEDKAPKELKNEVLTGMFDERIRAAIERMSKFDAGVRTRAKSMAERIFSNFEIIIKVDPDEVEQMEDDEKANYVNLAKTVQGALPDLVKQLESGYGIRERNSDDSGNNIMNDLMGN